MAEIKPIDQKCPNCGKKWIRANIKLRNFVCRSCGHVWVSKKLRNEQVFVL